MDVEHPLTSFLVVSGAPKSGYRTRPPCFKKHELQRVRLDIMQDVFLIRYNSRFKIVIVYHKKCCMSSDVYDFKGAICCTETPTQSKPVCALQGVQHWRSTLSTYVFVCILMYSACAQLCMNNHGHIYIYIHGYMILCLCGQLRVIRDQPCINLSTFCTFCTILYNAH